MIRHCHGGCELRVKSKTLCTGLCLLVSLLLGVSGCSRSNDGASVDGSLVDGSSVGNISVDSPSVDSSSIDNLSADSLPLLSGAEIALEQFQGKWVFINYWAVWCRPCVAEIPELNQFSEQVRKLSENQTKTNIDALLIKHPRINVTAKSGPSRTKS